MYTRETLLDVIPWGFTIPVLEREILSGADVNVRDEETGETPLHQLMILDELDYEAVKFLLLKNADPNIPQNDGKTPLHLAAGLHKTTDIIELLLKNGAKINTQDRMGDTPLHEALTQDKSNIANFLLNRKANHKIANVRGELPYHVALRSGTMDAKIIERLKP